MRMQTKNQKKYFNQLISLLVGLVICMSAGAQNSRMALHMPARNLINAEKIEREVAFLADSICQGRGTGTKGSVEAASWIARKFRDAGLVRFGSSWGKALLQWHYWT